MAYGATPVDGSSPTPIPMSSAVPDGSITPLAIAGGPSYTDTGNTKVPVSMYVKDGNDLTQGLTTDVAVTGDTAGTLSAKLRGLSKMLFDMWDSTNHWMQVKVMNATALGQAIMTGSAPVVIASDQTPVAGKRTVIAAYTLASTTTSGATQNSGDLAVGAYTEISIDITTTAQAGTSPTIQYFYERKGADGLYYTLWQSAVLTLAANTLSTSIGAGLAYNQSLGLTGRLRWVIGGSATPTFTHSLNVYGK